MTIIVSSTQAGISTGDGLGSSLSAFGEAVGIPGILDPAAKPSKGRVAFLDDVRETTNRVLSVLQGHNQNEKFRPSFTGSGRHVVPGGSIEQGKVSPLEDASVRKITSQAPKLSILVKKREFSSLNHLYTPSLMDNDELWLFRAIKRLFQRKCAQITDYERLSKIQKIASTEHGSKSALLSLVTYFGAQVHESSQLSRDQSSEDQSVGFFSSALRLERTAKDLEPVETTTWFLDPDLPIMPELGVGSGVFEITLVTNVSTSLSIDGSGSCNISLENPYNLLLITEHDIELAIRDTALSNLTDVISKAAGLALLNAQRADSALSKLRRQRRRSAITFSVDAVGGRGATAIIDAIGLKINEDNLASIPDEHSLDSQEQSFFITTLNNLNTYSSSISKSLMNGLTVGGRLGSESMRKTMEYVRRTMRKFYMGKLMIQPMDTVNVFMDGGRRLAGEGMEPSPDRNPLSTEGIISNTASLLGLQDSQEISDNLMEVAWERSGKHLSFNDFKKLNSIDFGGTHVFAGLVRQSSSRYSADHGRYEVSVSVGSNMDWLSISRYNKEPASQQTQSIVYDPLTPFKFETDPATGLPTGKAELTDTNKRILGDPSKGVYFQRGRRRGEKVESEDDLIQDIKVTGGRVTPIFEMPPGFKYRWKEGIVTVTYDMSTIDPLDKTRVQKKQLRRDIGQFASNTPFDNMDAANIISTIITGQPYNIETFVQSARNTGGFSPDTLLNSGKDYFHTLIHVQQSLNLVQGNFSPFKHINVDRSDMASALSSQIQLTQKSSELRQLRNQQAKTFDDILNLERAFLRDDIEQAETEAQYKAGKASLEAKLLEINDKISTADDEFSMLLKDKNSVDFLRIAGDDVTFNFIDPTSKKEARLFGDKLTFVTQRRKEDVIYNKDKNYLVISEEYDKDFDIQAFALQMRQQNFNMWKSTWLPVLDLCKRAAETLDFEFFVNSQGHIVFRPPQYNKTPLSVMESMISLNKASGIRLFPEFLEKLMSSREESLINDVITLEWEIRRQGALLGLEDTDKIGALIGEVGVAFLHTAGKLGKSISQQRPLEPKEKARLKSFLSTIDQSEAQSQALGIFSAQQQLAAQQVFFGSERGLGKIGAKATYDRAVNELVRRTGKLKSSFQSFEQSKVGSLKNGKSTPASDISGIIGVIAGLFSKRSKLLRTLDGVLKQSVEIAEVNESGTVGLGIGHLGTMVVKTDLFDRLIEDDSKHVLGHLSSKRFVIGEEDLINYSITERPPRATHYSVAGTDPLIKSQAGSIAGGFPLYLAIGTDFDLWRQYGFRGDKPVEKPFFWDAEKQCAPYAKMLLSRERRDLLRANATVVGNEFYQLGDVVYLTDLQMLFYVYGVNHSFTFESGFSTSLDLRYGHAPGEYIPTPLDIIGKSLSNKSGVQVAYRTRRQRPARDTLLGVVKFPKDESDIDSLLNGTHGKRNFDTLSKAALVANTEINTSDTASSTSPRVIIMTFGDESNKSTQETRSSTVKSWFSNPVRGGANTDIVERIFSTDKDDNLKTLTIPDSIIDEERLNQKVSEASLNSTDLKLLKAGIVASGDSWALDETLDTVVEVRLRRAPPEGWKAESPSRQGNSE
jgi:hypothetical protein